MEGHGDHLTLAELSRLHEKYKKNKAQAPVNPLEHLDTLLAMLVEKHPDRNVVADTAAWIAQNAKDPWTIHIQIKLRTWISGERARTFNNKLMLFYVIHEFLKIPSTPTERKEQQNAWIGTVEHILQTCIREMDETKKVDDNRKKLLKTLGRWEELNIFRGKLRDWKRFVNGEARPRKPPAKILVPGVIDPFDKEGMNLHMSVHRLNLPCLMEVERKTLTEKKRHWRYTGVAFIDALSHALGLPQTIFVTAMHYYHKLFDKGFFAQERFKVAAACLFLAAKASSQRMRLLRMVHVMHYILETPLQYGDEEKEELERMHLLHYEIQVLRGIAFELTIELPFVHLTQLISNLPSSCDDISELSRIVLRELFWTTMCIDYSAVHLAQASIYIACHMKQKHCESAWLKDKENAAMVPLQRTTMLEQYMQLHEWKAMQRMYFEDATKTDVQKQQFLLSQKGGLTWPAYQSISLAKELTNQHESRAPLKSSTHSSKQEESRRTKSPTKEYRSKPKSDKRYSSDYHRYSRSRSPSPKYRSSHRSRSPKRSPKYSSSSRSSHKSRRRSPSYEYSYSRSSKKYESDSSTSSDDRYRRSRHKYYSSSSRR